MSEAIEGKQRILAERLLEVVQDGELNEYKAIAIQMVEQFASVNLLSAAMKLMTGEKKDAKVELTPEDPVRAKRRKPSGSYGGGRSGGGYKGGSGSGYKGGGYKGGSTSGRSGGYQGNRSSSSNGTGGYKGSKEGGYQGRGGKSSYQGDRPAPKRDNFEG